MGAFNRQQIACVLGLWILVVGAWVAVDRKLGQDHSAQIDASPLTQDYWTNALGHAFNLDAWLEDGRRTHSYYANNHPGLPVQLASWLALRLSASSDTAVLRTMEACDEPSGFVMASRRFCLLFSLLTVSLLFLATARHGLGFAVATSLAAYTVSWSFHWATQTLGEDLFTMLLAVVTFGYASRVFSLGRGWLGLGALACLAYLNKLPYLTWTVGLMAGWACWAWQSRVPRVEKAKALLGSFLGFLLAFVSYAVLYAGTQGVTSMLRFHFDIATHNARYGYGEPQFWPAAKSLGEHLSSIVSQAPFACLGMLGVLGLSLSCAVRNRARAEWRQQRLPLLVSLSLALILGFLSLLKHYQWYYVTLLTALLPPFYWALAPELSRRVKNALTILTLCGVCWAWNIHYTHCAAGLEGVQEARRQLTASVEPGRSILWGYRAFGRHALRGRVYLFAGQPRPLDQVMEKGHSFEVKASKYLWAKTGEWTPAEAVWDYAVDLADSAAGFRYPWEHWRRRCRVQELGPSYQLYARSFWRPLSDPQLWRWSETAPELGWAAADFEASSWALALPGFGAPWRKSGLCMLTHLQYALGYQESDFGAPYARRVRTVRSASQIWMRRTFSLDSEQRARFMVVVSHDSPITVHLNGHPLTSIPESTGDRFRILKLTSDHRAGLRIGENILAVHGAGPGYVQVIPALRLPPWVRKVN